jgi:hypothetical protein
VDKTAEILNTMLKENTGRALCDSGDAYGRNWQRNQGRDFEKEEPSSVSFSDYKGEVEISVTHNLYHWLLDRLTYDEALDKLFYRWAQLSGNDDKNWLELMEEFAEKRYRRSNNKGYTCESPYTDNSYNCGSELISQTIQYTLWSDETGYYVLLQVHGGCDVRGGYSAPHVFYCKDEYDMSDYQRGAIQCDECDDYWSTDDGYNWYYQGCCGGDYRELNDHPSITVENAEEMSMEREKVFDKDAKICGVQYDMYGNNPVNIYEGTPKEAGIKGYILIDGDEGYCPICGKGKLKSYLY